MDSARLTCVRLARGLLIGAVTMGIFRARVCLAAGLAAAASAAVISCTNKSLGPLAPGATSGGGASVSPGAQFGPQPNADFSNCGASASSGSSGGGGGVSFAASGTTTVGAAPGAPEFTSTVSATAPPPPISGGTLIGLGSGNIAVASDPDRDAIYVVDTSSYKVVAHFQVNVRPRSVAFLSAGGIGFIPSESTGELNVIDTVNARVSRVIALPVGSRPMSVKLSPDEKKLYVSNGRAGTISAFDAHSYELLDTIKVGTRPWGIAVSPDGKYLFSANGPSNDVSVVDLATNKEISRVKAGASPWGIAVSSRP